jgi:hypothetical protein
MPFLRRWSAVKPCHSAAVSTWSIKQRVALLMGQVPRQLDGQGIDGVHQPMMAVVMVGERVVDGGKQRVNAAVLILHRLQHGDVVGTAGQVGPHPRPQIVVLGSVVVVQLRLEQLPAGENSGSPGWVLQIGVMAAGGAGQVGRSPEV